jgi:hypothetical protein
MTTRRRWLGEERTSALLQSTLLFSFPVVASRTSRPTSIPHHPALERVPQGRKKGGVPLQPPIPLLPCHKCEILNLSPSSGHAGSPASVYTASLPTSFFRSNRVPAVRVGHNGQVEIHRANRQHLLPLSHRGIAAMGDGRYRARETSRQYPAPPGETRSVGSARAHEARTGRQRHALIMRTRRGTHKKKYGIVQLWKCASGERIFTPATARCKPPCRSRWCRSGWATRA